MQDEKDLDLEQTLNAMKNGTGVKFDRVNDQNPQEPEEESEPEKKIKKDEENSDESGEKQEEGKKKKEGEDDDDNDDDEVVIATTASGASISACAHKTKSVLDVLQSSYEITPEVNKQLLSRTKENISNVKKAMKKQQFDNEKQSELANQIHDLCTKMNNTINSEVRRSRYQDNGMSKALAMAFEPFTELSYVLLSMTPTKIWNDQFLVRTQDLLNEVAEALGRVNNARTYSERILLLMSLGSQYRTLFSTHPMLNGEVNFINGRGILPPWNVNTYTDMWEYYLYDDDANEADPIHDAIRHRGEVGDNAAQPDVTLTKPFFMFFVDDELIYNLRKLHISDNALAVLGNYGMPTDLWAATQADETAGNTWEPENETYLNSAYSTDNRDGHVETPHNIAMANKRRNFTWSHNGTLNIISKTPMKLRSRNDAFVNEVKALIDLARTKVIVEISEDVAFFMVLTLWLNAAFKYMIDINSSFMNYVKSGSKVDADRFIPPYVQNIILSALSDFTPTDKSFTADSILSVLFDKMDLQNDRTIAAGFRYSQQAYDILKKEFNSATYTINGDDEYYIGDAKVGNNKIVVTILQKLYLPVDLLAQAPSIETGFVSSNFTRVTHTITDPYMFGFATANAKFNKRRGVAESGILMNFSLFHFFARMTNAEYNAILADAMRYHTFRTLDDEETNLNNIFGFGFDDHHADHEGNIPYLRVYSPLTPAYKRSALLHQAPCSVPVNQLRPNTDADYHNPTVYLQPLWDASMQDIVSLKSVYHGANFISGATLGWCIQALINEHADTSWIMSALILSQLKSTMRFRIIETATLQTINTNITSLNYWVNALSNNTGDIADALYVGGVAPAANTGREVIYSTLMRRVGVYLREVLDYSPATMDNPYEKITYVAPATSVSTTDIVKAFRYVTLNYNGNNVIIDNKFKMADKTCPKVIYYTIAQDANGNSQIAQYARLIRDGEQINITEQSIIDQVKTPEFIDEAIIIFDNFHVAANQHGGANNVPQYNESRFAETITSVPGVIPNTNFVGYTTNMTDVIIETLATDSKVDLALNDVCYITSDFYPSSISYTMALPLCTYRSAAAIDTHEPAACINAFDNLRCFEILANAFHRCGFDAFDEQSTYAMLAAVTGVDANINFHVDGILIRDHDIFVRVNTNLAANDPYASVGFGFYPPAIPDNRQVNPTAASAGKDNISVNTPVTDEQAESFNSSYRYPKMIVVPATTAITGMPVFFDYILGGNLRNQTVASKKTKAFFDKFNSIVPDQGYGFYLRNNDEDSALFNIALNGNPNYQGNLNDQLVVSFTIRDVLKNLDIFFRDR